MTEIETDGIRVVAIHDADLLVPILNFTGTDSRRASGAAGEPAVPIAVNCYLLEHEHAGHCLIDTGIGTVVPGVVGELSSVLAKRGRLPIDRVFLTHLHIDHIGGLVSVPELVGPDTEILVSIAELDWWTQSGFPLGAPESQGRSRPIVERFLHRFGDRIRPVGPTMRPLPDVEQVPLPGHTPGHTGFWIGRTRSLFLWADIVHSVAMQFPCPESGYVADVDGVSAALLRRRMLKEAASNRWLIAGMHLPAPGLGYVTVQEKRFDFQPYLT